jgi:hypothetical protein
LGRAKRGCHPSKDQEARRASEEKKKEIPMLKKIAVLAMTLASFGALIPATAAAAERRPVEKQVIVQKKVVHRNRRVRRVVVKPVRHERVVRRNIIVKRG